MSSTVAPDFMEWVVVTLDGWILKKDAPPDVVAKFKQYFEDIKLIEE